ncbi:MAG: LysR family transcriptional regulator, partial [Polaromonas sp.]
ELRAKKLVRAGSLLEMTMDVRVYRERPTGRDAAKSPAQALWSYLQAQTGARDRPAGRADTPPAVK